MKVTHHNTSAMSGDPARTPFILIITKPANALDFKALQLLQAASDTVKSHVSVAETTNAALITPVMQDNTGPQPVRSDHGLPALEFLAKLIQSLSTGSSKQASQAEQRRRLLDSFMTGTARTQTTKPTTSSAWPVPSMQAPSMPARTPPTATTVSYHPTSAAAAAHSSPSVSAPADLTYFSGQSTKIGSIGTPISDMFLPKDLQATDIVPRDPPKELLERMRVRTADTMMEQFGALDKRTDIPIETQIDDRAKSSAESTMDMGR
jgi:hypothetical protein